MRGLLRETGYQGLRLITGAGSGLRLILMYHSIGQMGVNSVARDRFDWQMALLRERFRVVRVCDLRATMARTSPDENLACVTLDDGYLDNFDLALPVLEKYGIKATFFVTTGYLGQMFRHNAGEWPMMTSGQVRELESIGHEIGAHTISHPRLPELPRDVARTEIDGSRRTLEDLVGHDVTSFAYPYGAHDDAVRSLVAASGFAATVTTKAALVERSPDWLALPRVWVSGSLSMAAFDARLSPATRWYSALRTWRR